jgi:formamidopyrimidine-DNA glycosylase
MPELPEVETIARILRAGGQTPPLPGRSIQSVTLHWPRHIDRPAPDVFQQQIKDRQILAVQRRGKYLVFPLDYGTLLIHLRMSGDLYMRFSGEERSPYEHTVFHLDQNTELRFRDSRKFGRVYLVQDPEEILRKLGPEPLDPGFNVQILETRLKSHRRQLKPLLLDQSFLAGLGNIYTDEILHLARLHPLRRSDSLRHAEVQALFHAMQHVLQEGLDHNGASIDWIYQGGGFQNHLRVYQKTGEPCPTCCTPIERMIIGQRGSHFCPVCQHEERVE